MFKATITLFDEYYRRLDAQNAQGFNRDLGCEVRERLQQLDYIVDRVQTLEAESESALKRSGDALRSHVELLKEKGIPFEQVPAPPEVKITKAESEVCERAFFEIRLLTEAFYYIAARVRAILCHKKSPLPGLSKFECVGVRDVRNKLLEHTEGKDSQVFIQSFGFGGANGPVLKAIRYSGQESIFPDAGLYKNATEFRDNLEKHLQKVLSQD